MRSPINEFVFSSETSEAIGWTILHSLWQLVLLAALFAIARWWIGRSNRPSASTTYWLGCVCLFLMAAAPIATFLTIKPAPASEVVLATDARETLAQEMIAGTSESRFLMLDNENDSLAAAKSVSLDELGRGKNFEASATSNQGYILLSEVITKAAGKPFVEVSKELIFDPCSMTGTCFNGDEAPKSFLVSTGVGELGAPRSCLEHPYGKIELVYQGTGGIVSNVQDIWKFHKALMGEELLNKKSKAELFDAGNFGYALGWRIGKTSGGDTRHSHGGRVRGFNCNFARYPDSDSCIVVLSNNDAAPTIMVTNVIEGVLFPAKMPKALDAELAKKCVGQYKDSKGRVLSVEISGAQATYAIFWGPGNPNAPVSRGYLLKNESDEIVMYQPGDVSAVELVFGKEESKVKSIVIHALDLTFKRTK